MTLIDTNVVLRYLLNDIEEQADKAADVIENGAFTLAESLGKEDRSWRLHVWLLEIVIAERS